jgi:LPXTG-motif cell wall-anchored protein
MKGFSKESEDPLLIPSIIYTSEHEIVPVKTNEILYLIIGLSIGGILGLLGVVIISKKKKN